LVPLLFTLEQHLCYALARATGKSSIANAKVRIKKNKKKNKQTTKNQMQVLPEAPNRAVLVSTHQRKEATGEVKTNQMQKYN
jgi:hypothetical protein